MSKLVEFPDSFELKINPTFRDLIPPLADHELEGLEEDILHFGCYSPIITWNGFIIDGHHRYEICTRHKLTFKTEEREFEGEKSVMIWMIDNQMGRRNITIAAKIQLAMKKHAFLSDRARKRQACGQGGVLLRADLPQANEEEGRVRDLIGKDAGCSGKTVDKFLYIEEHAPELAEKVVRGESDDEGKRLTIDGVYNKTKTEQVRAETIANLESIETQEVKEVDGVYDVVVLDPPWEIANPGQHSEHNGYKELPYPTMTVEEIKDLELPCADDCHVFLWTTQKFLKPSFKILEDWGLTYVCLFTWVKNGGFQPFNMPQFNTEFVMYAHKGNPKFVDLKQFNCGFQAKRGKHSEKPEEFYELLRRVTAGRRIDMFNRRSIEGFDVWGNESQQNQTT
jgi:N6-adenosine-specific RNA methylase IME4/ParB-like chromosome segregation protein Spo0J